MDYKTLLLSPKGRIGRKTYWLGAIGIMVGLGFVWGAATALMAATAPAEGGMGALGGIALAAAAILSLVTMWSTIVLAFKRCHDRDMSGWMMLIPFYNMWVSIQMAFLPGTPGPNRFGPDPLGSLSVGYAPA
jgi:uncharacterized membrane protein YhaH (DUF805 family)